jgi:hypothetical protein
VLWWHGAGRAAHSAMFAQNLFSAKIFGSMPSNSLIEQPIPIAPIESHDEH